MSLGPVMLDLEGPSLTSEEREILAHPAVGGVILFTRNYESPGQLSGLVRQIHEVRHPRLLTAVDHEGGRVQRFRDGFTHLPSISMLGALHAHHTERAMHLAETTGWLMASELRAVGVDISFGPVLDIERNISVVMKERCFDSDPQIIAELAHAYVRGMNKAGMEATGKHFPGHGSVCEDSHYEIPVDTRRYEDIYTEDILPFERMIHYGLAGIMPAHVIYEQCDAQPAGFSRFWITNILRGQLGFQGVIFSDDLSMVGAAGAGSFSDRAMLALDAGCDIVLICNDRTGAIEVIEAVDEPAHAAAGLRLARMHGRHEISRNELLASDQWQAAQQRVLAYDENPLLDMDSV